MADLNLKIFDKLYPMIIHKYKDLIPSNDATIMDKLNSIIEYLNKVGKLTNDVVKDWNTVYQWVMNDGLTADVSAKLDDMVAKGTFNDIFQAEITPTIGNPSNLNTTAKIVVDAINELLVDINLKANQSSLDTTNANVSANTSQINTLNSLTGKSLDSYSVNNGETDDTGRLQRAFNDIQNAGVGSLWIPDGKTYTISSGVTFPSNIRIWGKGTIKAKNGIAGISLLINNNQISGNSNIIIEGITLDGNIQNALSSTPYNFGIDLRNVNTVRVKDVTIKNTGGDGIYLGKGTANGCVNVLIERISVDNAGRNGVSVVYGSNITVRASSFTNIVLPANPGAAIDVEPNTTDTLSTVLIEDNYAYNTVYGFDVWGVASGVVMTDIIVRGNRAVNCSEGYLISSVNDLILHDNKAWHCTKNGMDISYTDKARIEGNTIIDCNTSNGSYYGILLYQYNTNAKVKNNNVYVTDVAQYQVTNIYETGTGNANNTFSFNNCYPFKTSGLFMGGTNSTDTMNTRYDTIPNTSTMKLGNRKWTTGTSAPTTGTWSQGDVCINTSSAKGQPFGWTCVTAGTSGSWLSFGEIRTVAKGQATMLASTNTIVITHGLPNSPTNIVFGSAGNIGAIWATSVGPTTFTINCATAPSLDTAVWWRADS